MFRVYNTQRSWHARNTHINVVRSQTRVRCPVLVPNNLLPPKLNILEDRWTLKQEPSRKRTALFDPTFLAQFAAATNPKTQVLIVAGCMQQHPPKFTIRNTSIATLYATNSVNVSMRVTYNTNRLEPLAPTQLRSHPSTRWLSCRAHCLTGLPCTKTCEPRLSFMLRALQPIHLGAMSLSRLFRDFLAQNRLLF